jgi:hypothetical protein
VSVKALLYKRASSIYIFTPYRGVDDRNSPPNIKGAEAEIEKEGKVPVPTATPLK